jgi:hypothetical protein
MLRGGMKTWNVGDCGIAQDGVGGNFKHGGEKERKKGGNSIFPIYLFLFLFLLFFLLYIFFLFLFKKAC